MFKIHLLSISRNITVSSTITLSIASYTDLPFSVVCHLFRLGTLRPSSSAKQLGTLRAMSAGGTTEGATSSDVAAWTRMNWVGLGLVWFGLKNLSFHCGSMGGPSNCDSEFLICFKCLLGMAYSGNHVKPNHKLLFTFAHLELQNVIVTKWTELVQMCHPKCSIPVLPIPSSFPHLLSFAMLSSNFAWQANYKSWNMWNLFNYKRPPFCLVKNLQGPSRWLYEVSQTIPCSIGDDHNISQWESGVECLKIHPVNQYEVLGCRCHTTWESQFKEFNMTLDFI